MPALFVGHGAAIFTTSPADATHRFLAGWAGEVDAWEPAGIVVVSAHHVGHPLRMTGAGPLATLHDHPAQAVLGYRYPGRGSAALGEQVAGALAASGLVVEVDPGRGLDHGAWVPLSLLHPSGAAPVLQLSLDARGSPADHVAIGAALASLREEGILLIGSGGVTHNQEVFRRGFFGRGEVGVAEQFSREFDAWVCEVVTARTGEDRARTLARFGEHPSARLAHPTVEHFLPLLVIAGAAGEGRGLRRFAGFQHSLSTAAFQFA